MVFMRGKDQCVLWLHETKWAISFQQEFKRCYGRNPPDFKTINQWHEKCKETDSVSHLQSSGRCTVLPAIFRASPIPLEPKLNYSARTNLSSPKETKRRETRAPFFENVVRKCVSRPEA
ncbi:hypothetical protein AVEN_262360-1 [Araneus ventricosus]|uniref:DUF4817 domain-containing protein n=1 Tax=Araneus ventricosus TaxID=182803 RepID=A0A4Y2M2Y0_ARAVE|nr:hypothetical protein AVEN_262360-1 [Araneus ventricosus]